MKSLLEKFYNAYKGPASVGRYDTRNIDVEIFLNPSSRELLRDVQEDARAYLAPSGDLYVATASSYGGEVIHADLLNLIPEVVPPSYIKTPGAFTKYIADADMLGVCMVRNGLRNEFLIAESYLPEHAEAAAEALDDLFKRASSKNPSIIFSKKVKDLI
jgi:hypothetical protein